jgi:CRISPR/Cas system CSM-associated protein Csm3 (group 7 of RAMP superfamily)
MNPYDFVPIVEGKKREKRRPAGHDRFSGKSGVIECTITTLKPFFIPHPADDKKRKKQKSGDPNEYVFNTVNGIPVIPGSSIKGVIRSVAEAAANSCVTFFERDKNKNYRSYKSKRYGDDVYSKYSLPDGFYPCTDIDNLCITCRLFGFQSSEKSFQGKINISDAKGSKYEGHDWITLTELSSPKPHHKAFYALPSDPDKIAGRKFYFHHKQDAPILSSLKPTHRNSSVKPIDKDAVFDFKVMFTNLTDDEYTLLLYSLFLEDGVCHKMGYGKPAGLGSVQIKPSKLTLFDTEKRYKGFTSDDRKEKSGEELRTYVKEQTKIYREDKSLNLEALRRIWKWPGDYDIRYPDFKMP